MNKKRIMLILGGTILTLLLVAFFAIYLPYINRLTPFNTDFINEIHVIKNGREIIIADSAEIYNLKTYFEGEYRCFNSAVNCFGVDEIENYRRYGQPVHSSTNYRFEVILVGNSETFTLFPADDCGYYTSGPLSFLYKHYYMLSGKVPDMFIQHMESIYDFN